MRARLALVTALTILTGACGSSGDSASEVDVEVPATEPLSTEPVSTEPPNDRPDDTGRPDDTASPEPRLPSLSVTLGSPVEGWIEPVDLTGWAGRETHVVERRGVIRRMNDDGRPGAILLDISELTRAGGERGLLGLAYSPDGTRAFVNHTDLDGHTVVARYDVRDDGTHVAESRRVLLRIDQPYANHNGGALVVTRDGTDLLVFTGDGGSANDPDRYSLDPDSLLGKVVRLDPTADAPRPEIWAVGLRNPWRVSLDSSSNDVWITDVGQGRREEVNVVDVASLRGTSFGWSAYEGSLEFHDDQLDRHRRYREVTPVHEYEHRDGDCSISGGAPMRDPSVDAVGDWYLFSDFCSGLVRALCVDSDRRTCGLLALGKVPASVGVLTDHRDRLWVLSLDGLLVPITRP